MQVRDVILYFSLKYKGDWNAIYNAISSLSGIDMEELEKMKSELDCSYVTLVDHDYPDELRSINRPPYVLYYYGDFSLLKKSNRIGVVGSRNCGDYSKRAMNYLLHDLKGRQDTVIISGMAVGIDTLAHQLAIDIDIPTIAVLGNGISYCYPKENYQIYDHLKEKGLIISEYPFKETVGKDCFSFRNRIITGLSSFIFVPEVHERSGTMVSVRYALNQGKDIFTIPYPIFEDNMSNVLIQEGAKLITEPNDIIEELK